MNPGKNSKQTIISGHFIAMHGEKFEKGNMVTAGHGGVFLNIQDLIDTIDGKPLNKDQLRIINVEVPVDAVSHQHTTERKFGIKSGRTIKVTEIQPFNKVKECTLTAIAS